MSFLRRWHRASILACLISAFALPTSHAADQGPVLIGLDADMSASTALGGEAIRRGAIIAIEEINRTGGVLGRPFELVVRDHRGNPDRGIDNIAEFGAMEELVAVLGGVHTPVAMAEIEAIHEHEVIYLGPWAAGTFVVENGNEPNFVYRISVRDEYAGEFLIDAALARGYKNPGLLLWQTAWGRSNEVAMKGALQRRGMKPAAIEWFNTGTKGVGKQLEEMMRSSADVIMLVAQPDGATTVMRDLAALPDSERLPVIAHWGFTGSAFHDDAGSALDAVDLTFLQTFSFFAPPFADRADRVMKSYCMQFDDCDGPASIFAPTGTAHAYDLVHILAKAIEAAGSIERSAVRRALDALKRHDGLVRVYEPPFTPHNHDALGPQDFRLATYDRKGVIVPLDLP
ncbi:MAG: ABC transporter substrate-binding protein [Geminicoccaceae bacterium]